MGDGICLSSSGRSGKCVKRIWEAPLAIRNYITDLSNQRLITGKGSNPAAASSSTASEQQVQTPATLRQSPADRVRPVTPPAKKQTRGAGNTASNLHSNPSVISLQSTSAKIAPAAQSNPSPLSVQPSTTIAQTTTKRSRTSPFTGMGRLFSIHRGQKKPLTKN